MPNVTVLPDRLTFYRPWLFIAGIPAGECKETIGLIEKFLADPAAVANNLLSVLSLYRASLDKEQSCGHIKSLLQIAEKPADWAWMENLRVRRAAIKAIALRCRGTQFAEVYNVLAKIANNPKEDHRVKYLAIWAHSQITGSLPEVPPKLIKSYKRYSLSAKAREEDGLYLLS